MRLLVDKFSVDNTDLEGSILPSLLMKTLTLYKISLAHIKLRSG